MKMVNRKKKAKTFVDGYRDYTIVSQRGILLSSESPAWMILREKHKLQGKSDGRTKEFEKAGGGRARGETRTESLVDRGMKPKYRESV